MQYAIAANSIMAIIKKIVFAIANVVLIVAIIFAWIAFAKYFTNYRKCKKNNSASASSSITSSSSGTTSSSSSTTSSSSM